MCRLLLWHRYRQVRRRYYYQHRHLAACLKRLNADAGSAARIERLVLLDAPPDLDAGEITDKGYINQRAVLDRRDDAVQRLLATAPGPGVITPAT